MPDSSCEKRDSESSSDLHEILEAQVGLASFDGPHERTVNLATVSEPLLRIPLLSPKLTNSLPQCFQNLFHFQASGSISL
jgi:hypothetical protein